MIFPRTSGASGSSTRTTLISLLAGHLRSETERSASSLASEPSVPTMILTYLNRLSDWLFVHARLANHQAGVSDVPWEKQR